jgi:hypothetical protein
MGDTALCQPVGQLMEIDGEGAKGLDVVIVTVGGDTGHDLVGGDIETSGIGVDDGQVIDAFDFLFARDTALSAHG